MGYLYESLDPAEVEKIQQRLKSDQKLFKSFEEFNSQPEEQVAQYL